MRNGRLREVPATGFNSFEREKFGVLDRWSLTRGGRTWRFDCNYFVVLPCKKSADVPFTSS